MGSEIAGRDINYTTDELLFMAIQFIAPHISFKWVMSFDV